MLTDRMLDGAPAAVAPAAGPPADGEWSAPLCVFVCDPCVQTGPTVYEQVSGWAQASYDHLTDGKISAPFQLAVAALLVERICYTWVHAYSAAFVSFCATPLGRCMGSKPLDVVFTIFKLNKVGAASSPFTSIAFSRLL